MVSASRRGGEQVEAQDAAGSLHDASRWLHSFGTWFPVSMRGLAMLPPHFARSYQNPSMAQTLVICL